MFDFKTPGQAVSIVKSDDRVFIQGGAATPNILIDALSERKDELQNVEICHIHTEGPAPYVLPQYDGAFRTNAFFVGGNIRPHISHSHVQYIPIFLSEVPLLFRRGVMPLDVAMVHVSPPDLHGFCSLGVSVDVTKAATDVAKKIIAVVNPKMPRSLGDGLIHASRFDAMVYSEADIHTSQLPSLSDNELAIGKHIANLVEDRATLQLGIGAIPNAVARFLVNHKDLGIHTEMFSDGILPLIEKGVITNKYKHKYPGKTVGSFAIGTQKLYDFIHDNPAVVMLDAAYVNDSSIIRKNPKMTAINSAIEIDLTGQVCSDSIGTSIYSGVGGQMDFIRGASLSEGGKPIIAIASVTKKGVSKIVPTLKTGAGVVTSRAHVHYVVTENGVAELYGKNIAQRVKELIKIAHPDHQARLEKEGYDLYGKCW
ncbi:MAG TPA: acetyl-CoA hydrolase/transferase C-terminal domain-containing protein [Saprospiraceae bacterium]|nr:4-hydroxybutyrate CoA-transferase [Saprospiraceae bacterium]MCC6689068.1 acetyl-CoA hydrolase/transferase family protein [Saprospiraceae bacterium]HMV22825.1 acetyl-CoA hydrolase/transferase C-terminal domain-containing protein [Saprospiraceae bacterium]HMX82502.1 acetyl-CoA hydrolase/transferase C-terminal domain-containing protein [Saprospiraceae bacterium]HMX85382.1 acetyl-CoA hydrolase/transferase C-terminal domain-containing protein [Saprospiraceae bacterium]